MANTLTNILPKLLARGVKSLRKRCVMPQLVNSKTEEIAKQKGATIDVPIPTAVGVSAVTPASTKPAATGLTPGLVQVSLSNWYQNDPIALSDQEMTQINASEDFLPMQMEEAIKALAETVNLSIHNCYKGTDLGVYGWVGTAGTTPFGASVGTASASQARKVLNQQQCPKGDRRAVLDFEAEAAAIELGEFQDVDKAGDDSVKREGELGRKLGFDWYSDDDVVTHTAGTIDDGATPNGRTCAVNLLAGYAAGVSAVTVDNGAAASLTGTLVLGDIISFAGHDQTYCIIANTGSTVYSGGTYTAAANAMDGVTFYPPLQSAVVNDEVITVKDDHVVNLAFHRDAFAFATCPLLEATRDDSLGARMVTMSDPVSGLSLRLEVSRQHKQTAYEFDILWGCKLVRPELAVRIAG